VERMVGKVERIVDERQIELLGRRKEEWVQQRDQKIEQL